MSPRRKGQGQLETMSRQAFLERVQKETRERIAVDGNTPRGVFTPKNRRRPEGSAAGDTEAAI